MEDTKLKAEALALLSVFSLCILFYFYFYLNKRKLIFNKIIRPLIPSWSSESLEFLSEKLTGILFTGIIPFIIFLVILNISSSRIGLVTGLTFRFRYLIVLLVLITCLLTFFASKKKDVREISADLKISDWYPRHLILFVSAWIFYIFGYELLFRGIVWFTCFEAFGFWPALLINLFLYAIVHLPKGKLMALGTLPTGLILCLLSHLTGSFLPAFVIHSTIAVSSGLFSLYHNPEAHFSFIRSSR